MSAPPSSSWTRLAAATSEPRSVTSASTATAPLADLSSERLDAIQAPRQQRHPMAVGRQCAGRRLADARRGAGNDRDAAGGVHGAHAVTVPPIRQT
jgi:hypothetical protein